MDCNEARPLLDANADHELTPPQSRDVQRHIESCESCRRESEMVRAMKGAVRSANYYRAPDDLRERIMAALPSTESAMPERAVPESEPQRQPRARQHKGWREWLHLPQLPQLPQLPKGGGFGPLAGEGAGGPMSGSAGGGWQPSAVWRGALALAFCALVAAGVAVALHRTGEPLPLVDELVASHVRAQLSGHDIDVVSSDQHTVKPWFNGKLDYAPPVEDLAASGFALAGGRLDYVGHRRVAVLTYRHAKHVIDVYVFPEDDRSAGKPGPALVRDGYAVARWRDDGMMWWAVTDAAPESLTALQTALTTRLHGGQPGTPYSGS
ncbi:anti-sigma factor [Paraburkholderia phymatum]|uniref:Putative transmembrane anti-sigma factor n=1 Tax=Paraburkholderia phymatum (strain DSM 17167 / CIP 108236 / LMG 21445 / STM815) TaxID=391038 RepID=B2JG17_PARP8|nr:anti-sigma factor [Paraburkholderia phymatum]ACC70099.1 putative transmembrane anti-sigma factor [Paraburkholderia phymatum STM815]